jgi:general stress protein 26
MIQSTEAQKVKDLVKDIKMTMLTSISEDGSLHSRPMTLQEIDSEGNLWFFTSVDGEKSHEIEKEVHVNLAFSQPKDNTYVSVSGIAEVIQDRAKAEKLWSPVLKAWFPKGLEDPELALLKVSMETAEYWDAPNGTMVQLFGMVKAVLTGKPYQANKSEHDRVRLQS